MATTSGSPACTSCGKYVNPGVVSTSDCSDSSCSDTVCSDCIVTNSDDGVIQGRDACIRTEGCATTAPSTACNPCFEGTTRECKGHIIVKSNPEDKCLKHLHSEENAFIVSNPTSGSTLETNPEVQVRGANGYQTDANGTVLNDTDGNPLVAEVPQFTKLWISGVVDRDTHKLFVAHPPNSTVPLYLKSENGCFSFASRAEEQLCAEVLPEKVTTGRLLLVDKVSDCEGDDWCVKELDFSHLAASDTDTACVWMTASRDANGHTNISYATPPTTEGIVRYNPANPCELGVVDTLTTAEVTQFTDIFNQLFCGTPDTFCGTSTFDGVLACGTRTDNAGIVTTGIQSFTLEELTTEIERIQAENAAANPVDTHPKLEDKVTNTSDGVPYIGVWDETDSTFYYRRASTEFILASQPQVALYDRSGFQAANSQAFSYNLISIGEDNKGWNYAEIFVTLDTRVSQPSSRSDSPTGMFFSVGGVEVAWAGQINRGQQTFQADDDIPNNVNSFSYLVPIVNDSFSITIGNLANTSGNAEHYGVAKLVGLKSIPDA